VARQIGADAALNTLSDPDALTRYKADKGYFETVFKASGSAVALAGAMEIIRPGGTIVQLGLSGDEMSLPINMLVAKEITLRGSLRFHAEFEWAVDFLVACPLPAAPPPTPPDSWLPCHTAAQTPRRSVPV
jgi:L-idonate 5-dehydrogenase